MPYSIRAAAPGDEQTLFGLIEGLARTARLAHEVTGNAAATYPTYPTLAVRVISPIRPLW